MLLLLLLYTWYLVLDVCVVPVSTSKSLDPLQPKMADDGRVASSVGLVCVYVCVCVCFDVRTLVEDHAVS